MSRKTLIALCLVAGVAVSLGIPTGEKTEAETGEETPKQPKITYSKETIVEEGEEVRIDCAVEGVDLTGVEDFSVSWSKIDEEKPTNSLPLTNNEQVLPFSNRYAIDHPKDSYRYSLIIKEAQEEDVGLYRCGVSFGDGQKINADVPVKMEKSPYFTDNYTKTLTVTEGDAISIDCQPGGSPKPDVFWERLNQELPYYGGKFFKANQLDIPLIDRKHEGHYVCYADNNVGEVASSHIILEVQYAPHVTVEKPQVFASSSDSVTLTCNVEAHPIADIAWYKNDVVLLGSSNKKLSQVDINEEGREKPIGAKSTLTITEVTPEDFGTYICKGVNVIGKTEKTVEVRLKSPPKIVTQSRNEVLYSLEQSNLRDAFPVVIECEADGAPAPNYRWTKDGEQLLVEADPRLDLEPKTGNLLISGPTLKDNGLYQCFAYNELGTALGDHVYLLNTSTIHFSNDNDKSDTYNVEAELGRPLKLSCPSAVAYPEPTMHWVKAFKRENQMEMEFVNDEHVVADPYGNLWFTHVTELDATGDDFQYICLGSTSFAPNDFSIASVINLEVVHPIDGEKNAGDESLNIEPFKMYSSPAEVTLKAGQENTLWCIFGGEPSPTMKWTRTDGVDVDPERFVTRNFGRTLVIKDTMVSDSGEYECKSSNGVGSNHTYTTKVTVEQAPTFVNEFASQTVKEGSTVTFTCEVESTDDVTFNWIVNGRPVSADANHPRRSIDQSMLTLTGVTLVDIGNYACNATSRLGYAYGQAILNVIPVEHRLAGTSSEDVASLRKEVADLREALQKVHELVAEQLSITKGNHEKLNEIGTLRQASCAGKTDSQMDDEDQNTTEEPMVTEESVTENIFNA